MYIYVQAKDGTPLMPTTRCGKVRCMLRNGRAVIASHTPFTIRLTYDTTRYTQPVSLGVNAGSKHIGLSATTQSKELYAAEIELRTDIVENLSTRREARRSRRSKRSIRYRAPRFLNRRASKKDDRLAPSVMQKVHSHVKAVTDVCRLLPVSYITIEVAQFDLQRIMNPDIEGTGYQQGPQFDFWNTREYVLFRDNHQCQHCHGKSKDPVLNVHHIESRKTGGDSPDNLVTLCETCHKAYHAGKIELHFRRNFASLRDAAAMNVMRWGVFNELQKAVDVPVFYTYGYVTKYNRIGAGLEKTHAVDARCISGNPMAKPSNTIWHVRQLRRHNRKVMKSNLLKGGRWKHNQAPYEIKGFRLFDTVTFPRPVHNGIPAYVHGRRTTGYFVIKDAEGNTITNSVSCKALGLIRHNNARLCFARDGSRLIPPPAEAGGILKPIS